MKAFKKSISVLLALTFTCLSTGNIRANITPKTDTSKKFIYMINSSDDSATLLRINTFETINLPAILDGHNISEVASEASLVASKTNRHISENLGTGAIMMMIGATIILLPMIGFMYDAGSPFKKVELELKFANITYVNLPYCKKVGEGGFLLCKNLQIVSLPECTVLSNSSFEWCDN